MATADRVYHQDYIARIRYSNTLPPPPNPPKLLNIPNAGLLNGVYTSTTFANKLAREQPLNIEADAELGMPIDLVGIPGVFEGEESALYGLDNPPAPHPHDKPLLRPLALLGKATSMTSGVSFLRRTEYISSDQGQMRFDSKSKERARLDLKKRKRPGFEDENDPKRIHKALNKGFDLAYPNDAVDNEPRSKADTIAWEQPRHPLNPDLHVLDTYPVLPDLDALTDSGFYILTKFVTNPSANVDSYDPRLDVGLLRPLDIPPDVMAQIQAMALAHEADPTQPAPPSFKYDYEYFLPTNVSAIPAIRAKFDVNNPQKDDPSLYDCENKDTGNRHFRYQRVRAYETYQTAGEADDYYGESVAVALHDPSSNSRLQKGAYYYPIYQRTSIRPRRQPGMGVAGSSQAAVPEDGKIDFLEVVVREPEEEELAQRAGHREVLLKGRVDEAEVDAEGEPEADAEGEPDV